MLCLLCRVIVQMDEQAELGKCELALSMKRTSRADENNDYAKSCYSSVSPRWVPLFTRHQQQQKQERHCSGFSHHSLPEQQQSVKDHNINQQLFVSCVAHKNHKRVKSSSRFQPYRFVNHTKLKLFALYTIIQ